MPKILPSNQECLKIAIVGTGIAGLASAWLLQKKHDVTLFEQKSRIGGHTNTVDVQVNGECVSVDTGFIVYNEKNYPNLTALFDHLRVITQPSEMSFSASLKNGTLEYSGSNLNGLFGQRKNLIKLNFWRMLLDVLRFYRESPALLKDSQACSLSLSAYLSRENYCRAFIEDHLLPMGSAIWSSSTDKILDYPVVAFVRFMESHGLLSLTSRPKWRTVCGGSQQYVKALTRDFSNRIRMVGVKSIKRLREKVKLSDINGQHEYFDHVVLATHADEALEILSDPDPLENTLLGKWQYTENRALLHTDHALMPNCKRVWSSWNFIGDEKKNLKPQHSVTYWMNRLQNLKTQESFFVTLNPLLEPASNKIIKEIKYTHPQFDHFALSGQPKLWSLQGRRRTWFCGSYFGFGFHEDALQAGLLVAEELGGISRPWRTSAEANRICLGSSLAVDPL